MADISRIARYSLEMDAPLGTQPIVGILQRTDKKADTIQVNLKQGGQAVSLTGATAAAYFKRPVDGAQVRCVGTVNGGAITVQLADQCYKNAGPFELLLKLVSGSVERTILRLTGYVEAGGDGAIVDPTGSIPSYDELEAAVAAATAAAETANTAAENADAKAQAAETAAGSASSAAQAANTAASAANTAAGKIDGLTVAASGLAPGAAPTAAVSEVDGHKHIAFGIPKGEKGNTGATPNIQIGTVSTGNPGTDAEASMGGTAEKPMLNLTIPRGADGSGSVSTVDDVKPASGNVPLGAVRYNAAQSLAEAQQAQARENMNAAKNAAMTGATASAAGAGGLVPAPSAGDEKKALLGDGTWGSVASSGGIYVGDTAPTDENVNAWMDTSEDVSGYEIANNLNTESAGVAVLDAYQGKVLRKMLGTRNLLDNSNFEIAQAGYGGKHGTQAYACDRWKLISGTVSHSSAGLTLNGTIAQVLENTPSGPVTAAASAGTITYDASAKTVTITTTEATVIAWAALYEGSYTADDLPPYTPKGYAAELAECQRYYYRLTYDTDPGTLNGYCSGSGESCVVDFQASPKMRIGLPTLNVVGRFCIRGIGGYSSDASYSAPATSGGYTAIDYVSDGYLVGISFKKNPVSAWAGLTNNTPISIQMMKNAYIELSADL